MYNKKEVAVLKYAKKDILLFYMKQIRLSMLRFSLKDSVFYLSTLLPIPSNSSAISVNQTSHSALMPSSDRKETFALGEVLSSLVRTSRLERERVRRAFRLE